MPSARLVTVIVLLAALASPAFAHEWMAPQEAAARKNPVAAEPDSIQRGKTMFSRNCALCHGENGRGAIPAAPDLIAGLKSHSDGDYFWKIEHGRDAMPGFGGRLEPSEIWDIINYLKSI